MTLGVDFLTNSSYIKEINSYVIYNIWDTAGQEEFDSITKRYYKGADIAIIAFSMSDRASYNNIIKWRDRIYDECGEIPIYLVMTKIDDKNNAQVNMNEASNFAYSLKVPIYFTSSKENVKIKETFYNLAVLFLKENLLDGEKCEWKTEESENIEESYNKLERNANHEIKTFKLKLIKDKVEEVNDVKKKKKRLCFVL